MSLHKKSSIEVKLNDQTLKSSALINSKSSLKLTSWRWIVLLFINIMVAGDYYCYDNPQALQESLQDVLNINAESFNWLYSIYLLPNIVLPLLGGRIIDFFGVRTASLLFSGFILFGQILVTFGGYFSSYYLILSGRGIYGMGGDCLTVTATFFISEWFEGPEIAFAYSFIDVTNGMFSALNSWISPQLYEVSQNLGYPLLIGASICLISFIASLCLGYIDKLNDKQEGRSSVKTYINKGEGINLKEMFTFPLLYWLIVLNYGFQSGAFFDFTNIQNDYIVTRYSFNQQQAGKIIAILVYGTGGLFPPLWGKISDKFGNRTIIIFVVASFPFLCHLLFFTSKVCTQTCYFPIPTIPFFLLGLYFSSSDCLTYPTFPIFLPVKKLATAYAGAIVSQNISAMIGPLIVGWILDNAPNYEQGYPYVSLFLLLNSAAGIIVIIGIFFADRSTGSRLRGVQTTSSLIIEHETKEDLIPNQSQQVQ